MHRLLALLLILIQLAAPTLCHSHPHAAPALDHHGLNLGGQFRILPPHIHAPQLPGWLVGGHEDDADPGADHPEDDHDDALVYDPLAIVSTNPGARNLDANSLTAIPAFLGSDLPAAALLGPEPLAQPPPRLQTAVDPCPLYLLTLQLRN